MWAQYVYQPAVRERQEQERTAGVSIYTFEQEY